MPESQRKGYGKSLIEFLFAHYSDCNVMLVGTGDCPSALSFYNNCGFKESHRIKNFFIDNYNISGNGTAVCDDVEALLEAGNCHICKKGSSHSIVNTGNEDLVLFTVVVER